MRLLYVLKGGRVSLQQIQRFKITISVSTLENEIKHQDQQTAVELEARRARGSTREEVETRSPVVHTRYATDC